MTRRTPVKVAQDDDSAKQTIKHFAGKVGANGTLRTVIDPIDLDRGGGLENRFEAPGAKIRIEFATK